MAKQQPRGGGWAILHIRPNCPAEIQKKSSLSSSILQHSTYQFQETSMTKKHWDLPQKIALHLPIEATQPGRSGSKASYSPNKYV